MVVSWILGRYMKDGFGRNWEELGWVGGVCLREARCIEYHFNRATRKIGPKIGSAIKNSKPKNGTYWV
jgi:hypothetical protein